MKIGLVVEGGAAPVSYTHLYKPIFPAFRLFPQAFGEDKRDRTADPLLAKQVLSQLSYTPCLLYTSYLKNSEENET